MYPRHTQLRMVRNNWQICPASGTTFSGVRGFGEFVGNIVFFEAGEARECRNETRLVAPLRCDRFIFETCARKPRSAAISTSTAQARAVFRNDAAHRVRGATFSAGASARPGMSPSAAFPRIGVGGLGKVWRSEFGWPLRSARRRRVHLKGTTAAAKDARPGPSQATPVLQLELALP